MKVIKKKSTKTFKGKDGKDHNYINYYLQCDNGKRICIKPVNDDDYVRLDMVSEYER